MDVEGSVEVEVVGSAGVAEVSEEFEVGSPLAEASEEGGAGEEGEGPSEEDAASRTLCVPCCC